MSNVLEEMKTRRSIRKFKLDAIPQEILDQIIEAGTYAANGRGAQNVIIIQVTNKEKRDEIAKKNAEIMGLRTRKKHSCSNIKISSSWRYNICSRI